MSQTQVVERVKRRSTFTPCAATRDQEQKWLETRAALVMQAPAFAHVFYTMMSPAGNIQGLAYWTEDVPIAATDGVQMLINPTTFFKDYSLQERVFIAGHEICHNIFNHCGLLHLYLKQGYIPYKDGERLPVIPMMLNYALDYVINAILVEGRIGKMPKDALHDLSIATHTDSGVDTYRKLFEQLPKDVQKRLKQGDKGAMQGVAIPGNGGKQFDEHLDPGASQGKDPGQATQERDQSEHVWKTSVAAGVASAKLQGKLPASLERLFGEYLEPVVDWTDKIKAFFARKVGGGGYDWRKADRRLITRRPDRIYAPARSGHGCGTIVVGVDTSGSIGNDILNRFFAEMRGILEDLRPERLLIIWCDAAVNRVDEVRDTAELESLRCQGAPGGGGTDFRPVFDRIDQDGVQPDALVYLTDGYGSFPRAEPDYPVLWGSITPDYNYPFGDVVDVPV